MASQQQSRQNLPFLIKQTSFLFRYITSKKEYEFIRRHQLVYSTNPLGTYWTTLLTNDANEAQKLLALNKTPLYRVGGIPLNSIDLQKVRKKGVVAPAYGQPGGADEIILNEPILLFITSIYDLQNHKMETFLLRRVY